MPLFVRNDKMEMDEMLMKVGGGAAVALVDVGWRPQVFERHGFYHFVMNGKDKGRL